MAYKRTVWASENMPDFKNGLNRIEDELEKLDKNAGGGVTSIGGVNGDILLGEGLQIEGKTLKSLGGDNKKYYFHQITDSQGGDALYEVNICAISTKNSAYSDFKSLCNSIEAGDGFIIFVSGVFEYKHGSVTDYMQAIKVKTTTNVISQRCSVYFRGVRCLNDTKTFGGYVSEEIYIGNRFNDTVTEM